MVSQGRDISASARPRGLLLGLVIAAVVAFALPNAAFASSSPVKLPEGFMWGIGGSPGFQSEMGGGKKYSDRNSDWWAWTHDAANISAGRVSGDLPENGPGGWKTGFADDIENASSLGVNTWRMGIEWSRIFPRSTASVKVGAKISRSDLKALDRLANNSAVRKYRSIIGRVRKAGMNPFLVINTYTLPLWIHDPIAMRDALAPRGPDDPVPPDLEKAGWLSSKTVTEYRKYAAYLAWKFGRQVDWWAPLNEAMVTAIYGYGNIPGLFAGNFPPGATSFSAATLALENMASANAAAYDEVHRRDRKDADGDGKAARVGLIHNLIHFTPADPANAVDVAATEHADQIFNRLFPDAAIKGIYDRNANGLVDPGERKPSKAGKADFFGVNYYFRGRVTGIGFPLSSAIPILDFLPRTGYRWAGNPAGALCPTLCSDFGAEIDSGGLGSALREAAEYGKPLIVTENGIADAADSKRPAFLVSHVNQVARAAKKKPNGVPVLGWFEWNLTDNYEWAAGYTPKFGLYSYDPVTLKRKPRTASTKVLSRMAKANAIPGALLDRYLGKVP